MIRVSLFNNKAYGFDVTGWEDKFSEWYDNLLTEDLIERVYLGDKVIYFDNSKSAEEWCFERGFKFEMVEDDDN